MLFRSPGTLHFTRLKHRVEYYNFNVERADGTKTTLSEADFPQLNPADLLTLSTHFKSLVKKYPQCKPIYDSISGFLKDYLYEIGRIDHDLYGMFESIPAPPHPVNNLPEIQQLSFGVVSKPELGLIYHLKNSSERRFLRISEKHLYPSHFLERIMQRPELMTGDPQDVFDFKDVLNWWVHVRKWMLTAIKLA